MFFPTIGSSPGFKETLPYAFYASSEEVGKNHVGLWPTSNAEATERVQKRISMGYNVCLH